MPKEIVSISLGPSGRDYEFTTALLGTEFHLRRLGTDGSLARARELVAQFDGTADAIGLGGMTLRFEVGRRVCVHEQVQELAATARSTPVVDGACVRSTLERWAISHVARQNGDLLRHKRVFVPSGIESYALAQVLSAYTEHITFGDPLFHFKLPVVLGSLSQLERYAGLALPILCRWPYDRLSPMAMAPDGAASTASKYFGSAAVIVGDYAYIERFAPQDLQGAVVIADGLAAEEVEDLRSRGVQALITPTLPLDEQRPFVGMNVLEAMLTSLIDRPRQEITTDDYLNLVARSDLEPSVTVLNEPEDVARFAFVIHPLSVDYIFNHPQLKYLRFLPNRLVERLVAQTRPMYLSRVTGVRSAATGQKVEGYLLGLGATPRELMRHKPGFTYRRLIVASRMAQQRGAQIMGLGAFTKVVGDAGMTVAYKSDIAITSGNSLTVAATLEAAKQAVIKMGAEDLTQGQAVIIGATGSIGSVCSRLIAQAIGDVVLVAPRPEKLIALKQTIEDETPAARVVIATDAGPHLAGADLVVTTTTAIGQKVIDVLQLKPGCVVCDVARPPDVKEEDAQLRPDVLIVEAGEILLPGEPDFGFDIGLPPGVAYACLAEAALLAMEGRFENFTLGRNIEMEKVKEIYRLMNKHGLQLEGLRSFGQYVSDQEIAAKRELADELRRDPEKLRAQLARAQAQVRGGPTLQQKPGRVMPWPVVAGVVAGIAAVTAWLLARRGDRG
ncbi:MAG: serine carboxypeptidase [Anaerolineae bacterium]|jgi:predicted amino acid dehydrogenase